MIERISVKPNTKESNILFFDSVDLRGEDGTRKIIPLFGANGSGKTTFLNGISTALKCRTNILYMRKKIAECVGLQNTDTLETAAHFLAHIKSSDTEIWQEMIEEEQRKVHLNLAGQLPIGYFAYSNRQNNWSTWQPQTMKESYDPVCFGMKMDASSLSEGQSLMYSAQSLVKGLCPGKDGKAPMSFENQDTIVLLDELDSGLSLDNLDYLLKKLRLAVQKRDDLQIFLSFNQPYVLKYFPDVLSMYDGQWHRIADETEMIHEIQKNKKMLDKKRKKSNGEYRIFE